MSINQINSSIYFINKVVISAQESDQSSESQKASKSTIQEVIPAPQFSDNGEELSRLYQEASRLIKNTPLPRYLPIERDLIRVDKAVADIAEKMQPSNIDTATLRKNLIAEHRFPTELPRFNPSSPWGDGLASLTKADREILGQAYDNSVENNLDLGGVDLAAHFLSSERFDSNMSANGTIMIKHLEPTGNRGKFIPEINKGELLSVESKTNPQFELKNKFLSGELFKNNAILTQDLFLNLARRILQIDKA